MLAPVAAVPVLAPLVPKPGAPGVTPPGSPDAVRPARPGASASSRSAGRSSCDPAPPVAIEPEPIEPEPIELAPIELAPIEPEPIDSRLRCPSAEGGTAVRKRTAAKPTSPATVRREIQRGMEETGVRKIELPECTLSLLSVPPSVIIIDESLLPDDFCTIVRKPDRKSIKAALEDGEVPGAMMSNGGTALSVRKA